MSRVNRSYFLGRKAAVTALEVQGVWAEFTALNSLDASNFRERAGIPNAAKHEAESVVLLQSESGEILMPDALDGAAINGWGTRINWEAGYNSGSAVPAATTAQLYEVTPGLGGTATLLDTGDVSGLTLQGIAFSCTEIAKANHWYRLGFDPEFLVPAYTWRALDLWLKVPHIR